VDCDRELDVDAGTGREHRAARKSRSKAESLARGIRVASAALLDGLLGELWGGHPKYVKIEGMLDFEQKMASGMAVIRGFVASMR